MNQRITILYFSPTGTTEKVLTAIAKGIDAPFEVINLTHLQARQQFQTTAFEKNDIVIVGAPVYSGRIPALFLETIADIKGIDANIVPVVVYGNRDYDDALLELKDFFEARGFTTLAAGAFIGEHSFTASVAGGRPDRNDLETAHQFGQTIAANIAAFQKRPLSVKGNDPYRQNPPAAPMAPETNETCNACGICAENCPVEAIDFKDYSIVDSTKCIRCCSCIKKCPQDAKAFTQAPIKAVQQKLIDNFSIRREPELFL
ncbi:EFR1 family ferrodoxin [Fusibacter paucivorans]|uniref:EFR1 family ferrodoxin n=1 Tax=Fusibacter paucivorans TaxID=76009 RepID=A0ABS5PKI2_9FIRM|nr:EFR1 family ferrodoxin [Fusibacter paucivorans]MBS7525352.1 EFR1 family ferrodoxin [Fusibacter paucivorans]